MDSTHGSGLDQATEDLISRLYLQDALQIEDAVDYFESGKGKSRELTDEELAFQLQNGELKDESRRYSDNRMAMSLATAVHTDGQILTDILLDEERAASGRAIKTPQAEFSAAAALRKQKPVGLRSCVACDDCMKPDNTLHAPCGHEYCRSCIEGLYNASLTDETLFPPRCCGQHIDIRIARTFLKSDLLERYEKKRIELETPNKTYCHFLKCSAFINTSCLKGQVATCPECNRKTCTSCKSQAHTGDCLDDPATQQLFATAKVNGWQRCYSCQRLVELDHGCNHMVCYCKAEFCYNCGIPWKGCACDQWNEDHLLARAHTILDRDPTIAERNRQAHQTMTDAQAHRARLIAETTRGLWDYHECEHIEWESVHFVHRPVRCEECFRNSGRFAFECRQCGLRVCRRCRNNRL